MRIYITVRVMENRPVFLRNQDGKRASGATPAFPILVQESQCSEKADQRTLLSNHNSHGLLSSAVSAVKSKVRNCFSVDCIQCLSTNSNLLIISWTRKGTSSCTLCTTIYLAYIWCLPTKPQKLFSWTVLMATPFHRQSSLLWQPIKTFRLHTKNKL